MCVCVCVLFCHWAFFFLSQTDQVLNPSHFANISNITYLLFTLILLNSSGIYSQVSVGIWIQGEGGAACRSLCNFISKGLSPFCSFIHLLDIKILTYIINFKIADDSFKIADDIMGSWVSKFSFPFSGSRSQRGNRSGYWGELVRVRILLWSQENNYRRGWGPMSTAARGTRVHSPTDPLLVTPPLWPEHESDVLGPQELAIFFTTVFRHILHII